MSKKKVALAAGLTSIGIVGISLSILMLNMAKIIVDFENFDDLSISDF